MIYLPDGTNNFDFNECLWFLDRGQDEVMHQILPFSVRKAIIVNGEKLLIEVGGQKNKWWYKVLNRPDYNKEAVEKYIKNWFDFDRDLNDFYNLLNQEEDLAFFSNEYKGLRLMGIDSLFEVLVWSIIGQQINLSFAYQIKKSLVQHIDNHLLNSEKKYYFFPKPEEILSLKEQDLVLMKFSRQKIKYILGLAEAFVNTNHIEEDLIKLDGLESKINYLTQFKGVGEWTAQYSVMKFCKEMNSVPYGDAGINQALEVLKNIPKKGSRDLQEKIYSKFEGNKAYLTLYLWRWLSEKKRLTLEKRLGHF